MHFLNQKLVFLLKQLTLLLTYVVTNDERNLTYIPHFVVSSFLFCFFFIHQLPSVLSVLWFFLYVFYGIKTNSECKGIKQL